MPVEESEDALGVLGIFVWREEQSLLDDKVQVALADPGFDVSWCVRDQPFEVGVVDLSIPPRVD